MAPNVKIPRTLRTPWPPTEDLLQAETVTGTDDWWSLQKLFKRCDVWDIIYYNFATYNPDEVNWYLREWIGCQEVTPQGNYRFHPTRGRAPMRIYIPSHDWVPPGPQQAAAQRAALDILRDPVASTMTFTAGPVELRRFDLAAVAVGIETGKIAVIHRPCLGNIAYYRGRNPRNQLLVPFASAPPLGMRALMVHEAVHAAMDVRSVPQTMQQSEGLSYIAQALYLHRNGVDLGAAVPSPPFAVNPRNFLAWTGILQIRRPHRRRHRQWRVSERCGSCRSRSFDLRRPLIRSRRGAGERWSVGAAPNLVRQLKRISIPTVCAPEAGSSAVRPAAEVAQRRVAAVDGRQGDVGGEGHGERYLPRMAGRGQRFQSCRLAAIARLPSSK